MAVCWPGLSGLAHGTVTELAVDPSLQAAFGEREVVFAARSRDSDQLIAFNAGRIGERHPPFSTFKLPNFLIALESGAVDDAHRMRDWDPARRPATAFWPESWRQPQSLMTAFRHSAVWFFRDVALAVGGERYRHDLARFGYGNRAAADGSDLFWLDGSLRISVEEQVGFIARLLAGEFGVDSQHWAALRQASLLSETGACRLHGKTGAGPVTADFDGAFEGWLVGWAECRSAQPVAYALWVRGESFAAIRRFRQEAAVTLLTRIGALQPEE